jgi:hypothetical protein
MGVKILIKIVALRSLVIGALLAISSSGVLAGTSSFTDGLAQFRNDLIAANGVFTQDITFTGLTVGTYSIVGDISASNMTFTSVTLNGTPWELLSDGSGRVRFGSIQVTGPASLAVHVVGNRTNASANYSGSLAVTPVPEPTSTAMLLGGLGLIVTITRRRNKVSSA